MFRYDYHDVRFILERHAELDFYNVNSLKQQSMVDMSLQSDTLS